MFGSSKLFTVRKKYVRMAELLNNNLLAHIKAILLSFVALNSPWFGQLFQNFVFTKDDDCEIVSFIKHFLFCVDWHWIMGLPSQRRHQWQMCDNLLRWCQRSKRRHKHHRTRPRLSCHRSAFAVELWTHTRAEHRTLTVDELLVFFMIPVSTQIKIWNGIFHVQSLWRIAEKGSRWETLSMEIM